MDCAGWNVGSGFFWATRAEDSRQKIAARQTDDALCPGIVSFMREFRDRMGWQPSSRVMVSPVEKRRAKIARSPCAALFGAECLGGIERCGAAGWNGGGKDGYCDEDEEGQDSDADVCGRDAVEEAADEEITDARER